MFLDEATWQQSIDAHEERVDELVAPHLARRSRGESHPVEDFLFTYYSFRPSHLRRWHPGFEVTMAGSPPHESWTGYERRADGVGVSDAYAARRAETVSWIRGLLAATADRPANIGCLGLHEWAMVYRTSPSDVRHAGVPLRLGHAATDEVVEANQIKCTHFDAFRFFTDDAGPLNVIQPTRQKQVTLEQPGCLHANMDLYKWAYKLVPLVPSSVVLDAFALAQEIRELDMRASPYDLSNYGYEPIKIETREGKAEYVAAQRAFAEHSAPLRTRLIQECDRLLAVPADDH